MHQLKVSELVEATSGTLIAGSSDLLITNISIDTRTIAPGDAFIPIKGIVDGHQYIEQALAGGAKAVFVRRGYEQTGEIIKTAGDRAVIEMVDGLQALQDIATYYRVKHLSRTKVIGITGSSGKTTTKDMVNCISSRCLRTTSTDKNFNNEIGVPLTILRAEPDVEVLIVEMAMRGPRQIHELAVMAKPDVGVITNIGEAHIELLGSQENIAQAKAELIENIAETGSAILNADDIWTPHITKCACSKVITYGITDGDVKGSKLEVDDMGRTSFMLTLNEGSPYRVRLPMPGRHNVYNALAAAATAHVLGMSEDDIRIGLANCRLSPMRMEILTNPDNVIVLNDAYNANPASMQAALAALTDIKVEGRHIAVIGDMLELGDVSREAHRTIGGLVADLGINILVAVGSESLVLAEAAIDAGMNAKAVIACSDAQRAAQVLKQLAEPGDAVLVKASRGIGLEEVVKTLVRT